MTTSPLATIDPARAWSPFEPGGGEPWDLPRIAHLHRRAGFAAPWAVLERDLQDGPDAAVARLLKGEPTSGDGTPAAAFDSLLDRMGDELGANATLPRLQSIWLYRMIFTPHPLRERMTLFWHNHFATSLAKVNNSSLMQRQNDLFRRHALGHFKPLLTAIGKDPAMLVWLDSTANRKARPNENYAREVMELFTLGRGHYAEKDVQEAARAFTGWFLTRDEFQEVRAQHDDGPKTILGQTGPWDGGDIPRILLDQPACAEFLVRKLVRQFVDEVETPPAALIAPLAQAFRESGYDIRVPVGTILRSNLFFDPEVRRKRVKSPVEFAVGTIRALEVLKPTVKADALAEFCGRMGQNLYAPPSVAGWDGGPAWANSTTMLTRANFVLALLSSDNDALGKRLDVSALAARHGRTKPGDVAAFLIDLLVQDAYEPKLRERIVASTTKPREAATLVLTSPEYQLA
jgi:uncharacterized protein (DUF1800 family)